MTGPSVGTVSGVQPSVQLAVCRDALVHVEVKGPR